MEYPYKSNYECIVDYLQLFRYLCNGKNDESISFWNYIQSKESITDSSILGCVQLRKKFNISDQEFLLVMVALCFEIDSELRENFRQKYSLQYPTIEYGLLLISPIYQCDFEFLAKLTKKNLLSGLLLSKNNSYYTQEQPLILCRMVFAWLSGLCTAEIPYCIQLKEELKENWIDIHKNELSYILNWYNYENKLTLFLLGPKGSGRKSLLLHAFNNILWAERIWSCPEAEMVQLIREIVIFSKLTNLPIVVPYTSDTEKFINVRNFCQQFNVPFIVISEEESSFKYGLDIIRLPKVLTSEQKDLVLKSILPYIDDEIQLFGDMTIQDVKEIIQLSLRISSGEHIKQEHIIKALDRQNSFIYTNSPYDLSIKLEDLVLPEQVYNQLRFICEAGRNSKKLLQWKIPRSKEGVMSVFYGSSGTGKTMAAIAIANYLKLPIFRIDLSQIMDKYVGETEKHLSKLLTDAKKNNCILLFDEADILFGKRTNISSGHDKYANLSTAFLLQEIESYNGIAILTSNLLQNIDTAFFRRFHYIVHFPMPNIKLRREIWERALPKNKRKNDIDIDFLSQIELSPANIFAIARSAAVIAITNKKEKFDMSFVQQAIKLELQKQGRLAPIISN